MQLSQQIWPALFACLSNPSEEVVRLDIEALARMAPNEQQFVPFIDHLLHLFRRERGLLEKRGALVVRQLCELLHPRRVFVTLSRALQSEGDLEFASQMVQTLNLILLATNECLELREMLKQASTDADGCALFQTLYPAWSHNPVSLLSICLLSKSHEHAAQLVMEFGSLEVEVPFLMQVTARTTTTSTTSTSTTASASTSISLRHPSAADRQARPADRVADLHARPPPAPRA